LITVSDFINEFILGGLAHLPHLFCAVYNSIKGEHSQSENPEAVTEYHTRIIAYTVRILCM
jgi:hypothetical protein